MESGFRSADAHQEPVGSPSEGGPRRERASIATQACETCRQRKSKCDEKRPKCSLCQRTNQECRYREPQPTKKDKTMVTILDGIQQMSDRQEQLIDKFDGLESVVHTIGRQLMPGTFSIPRASSSPGAMGLSSALPFSSPFSAPKTIQQQKPVVPPVGNNLLTAPHKVLLWPAIARHLTDRGVDGLVGLQGVTESGTAGILRHDFLRHPDVLPAQAPLQSMPMPKGVRFPALSVDVMKKCTEAYFSTFNALFPILEQNHFTELSLGGVMRDGFGDDDVASVLVLLVLSLGVVADQGANGHPLQPNSGIKGGSPTKAPGAEVFSEARRRMGLVMTHNSVENIQCLLLTALYYESCARHLDFWRCISQAAEACQVVLICNSQMAWGSPNGIAMKRVYWTWHLIESWFHFDLDLPQTELSRHPFQVPLPEDGDANTSENVHYSLLHFSALEWLRRLIMPIHSEISNGTNQSNKPSGESVDPPIHIINELRHQLDEWRRRLPVALQWYDADRFAYPNVNGSRGVPGTQQRLFHLKHGEAEPWRNSILDILTAQLRSRYYYAEFMVYRPFVFKALHHANLMTPEDREMAARCIKSALLWPMAMWPCRNRKRLVPMLFTWTQNFLCVLLVLRMLTVNECLHEIMERYLDKQEVEDTVLLLLDWMHDVKQIDGIAGWSWPILESLYDEPAGRY